MALGFLKSAREPSGGQRATASSVAASTARPDRASVLGEVEELGIGMFWATDVAGQITFLSQRALDD